ncbi:MAG TPA: helix-turn-helix domain-containing protein, partial [Lentisphaeria bacterium]|nr:helix-turn-helix domain-containing protein [Lentisphaeria bacterium]
QDGVFREDLFYRINVIQMEMPPLRERREDIPFLVDSFIRRFNLSMERNVSGISQTALRLLSAYSWPGNIRQLENVIERSMVFCKGALIEPADLPAELTEGMPLPDDNVSPSGAISDAVQQSERQAIHAALEKTGGNRRQAAQLLGIHPTTFYRKLKSLGIALELPDGRRKTRAEKTARKAKLQ